MGLKEGEKIWPSCFHQAWQARMKGGKRGNGGWTGEINTGTLTSAEGKGKIDGLQLEKNL